MYIIYPRKPDSSLDFFWTFWTFAFRLSKRYSLILIPPIF